MCKSAQLCSSIIPFFFLSASATAAPMVYETVVRDRHYTWTHSSQNIKSTKSGDLTNESYFERLPGNAFASAQNNTRLSFFPRGLSSQSVQVYVDGLLLNDPADPLNRYDFSNFNWGEVESVEYNPSSAFSGKPGGSLFIWTPHSRIKTSDEKNSHILQEFAPPYGALTSLFSAYPLAQSESSLRQQFSLSASRHYSRNNSQSLEPGVFERDAVHLYPLRFSWLVKSAATEIDFYAHYSYLREALDQSATKEDFNAHQIAQVAQGKVSLRQRWAEIAQLKVSLQQNYSRRQYKDPSDGPGDFAFGSDYRSLATIADIENVFSLSQGWELTPTFNYKEEKLRILGDEYMNWTTQREALLGARSHSSFQESWDLYLSARSDSSVGLTLEKDIAALGGHGYLNLARARNHPTLYQKNVPIYGNRSLKSEDVSTAELGLKSEIRTFKVHSAVFQSYGEEQIEFSSSRNQYENLSVAKVWGVFALFNFKLQNWDFENSHTYLDTELLRRSRWSHFFKLGRTLGPVLKSELSMRLNSRQKEFNGSIERTEDLSAKLLLTIKDDWRGWLKFGNILNQEKPFIPGYFRPGFNIALGGEHEF